MVFSPVQEAILNVYMKFHSLKILQKPHFGLINANVFTITFMVEQKKSCFYHSFVSFTADINALE